MSGLAFQEYELAGMKLRNRIVRSATFDPMGAEDAAVSEEQAAYYRMLAEHGIGLIISGMAAVSPDGASSKIQNGLYDDRFIAGHRMLTDAVHAAGGVVVAQINHTGDRAMGPSASVRRASHPPSRPARPTRQALRRLPPSPPILPLRQFVRRRRATTGCRSTAPTGTCSASLSIPRSTSAATGTAGRAPTGSGLPRK